MFIQMSFKLSRIKENIYNICGDQIAIMMKKYNK